jgi:uncharacterized membrane protein (UPF0127 family)
MNRRITNQRTGELVLARAKWCKSFLCHLKGLMFRGRLAPDEGLLFVTPGPSVINTTIHMLFMFMPIAVIWLDENWQVVDKKYAKPWRLIYAPAKAAQYYLEASPELLERVQIGDVWHVETAT